MDKNKNRTDLLAAGRKRLEQFRQKKEGKSSTVNHVKLLRKGGGPEKNEADANSVSCASEVSGLPHVYGGEIESERSDLDMVFIDSKESQLEEPEGAKRDGATVDPSYAHLSHQIGGGDSGLVCNTGFLVDDSVSGEAGSASCCGLEHDDGNFIAGNKVESMSSGNAVIVNIEGASGEAESELISSQQDSPGSSLIQEKEDQEADCLDSKQCDGGRGIEQDGTLIQLEPAKITSTLDGPSSEVAATMEEFSSGAKEIHKAVYVSSFQVGEKSQAEDRVQDHILPKFSDEGKHEKSSVLSSLDSCQEGGSRMDEANCANYDRSKEHIGESIVRPRETIFPAADETSTTLSKMMERVAEDEFRFLVKCRDSPTNAGQEDGTGLVVSECDTANILETFKQQIYFLKIEREFLYMQLVEESELHREFEIQYFQLNAEKSIFRASLNEIHERNRNLTEELACCQSELQSVNSGSLELHNKFCAAKAEAKEFLERMRELQTELEKSQGASSNLSSELADCKGLVDVLKAENATLIGRVTSVEDERRKLEEDKLCCVKENEEMSIELAEARRLIETLQRENSNVSGSLASATEERQIFLQETENLARKNEKLSAELADCKGLLEALQKDNANFSRSLISALEEREKLVNEKECIVRENGRLFPQLAECKVLLEASQVEISELCGNLATTEEERKKIEEEKKSLLGVNEKLLSDLHVRLELSSATHEENLKFQEELKRTNSVLEQLMEENLFLGINLNVHQASAREFQKQIQVLYQYDDVENQFERSDLSRSDPVNAVDAKGRYEIFWKQEGEGFALLDKQLSEHPAASSPLRQLECKNHDDSFGFAVFKSRLEEADKLLQQLENAVEGLQSQMSSLSTGDKAAVPGVSELIKAFESKAHLDEHTVEENNDQGVTEPLVMIGERAGSLRAILGELCVDTEAAGQFLKEERDGRKLADVSLAKINFQYEAIKAHANKLEAANIELEVQYEAMKQHVCSVEVRCGQIENTCEGLVHDAFLSKENQRLDKVLINCQPRINNLQGYLNHLRQSSNEMTSFLSNQLSSLQSEVAEGLLKLEKEWNSTINQIVQAVANLNVSVNRFVTSGGPNGPRVDLDIGSEISSSVNAATKAIEDLLEKLDTAHLDNDSLCAKYKDLNEKQDVLLAQNELAVSVLQRVYGDLKELLNHSSGLAEDSEISTQDGGLFDPGSYEFLIERLGNFLDERIHLESEISRLNLELVSKVEYIEEMSKVFVDSNIIIKLVGKIEGALVLEDETLDQLASPVSRLEHLVSLLLRKCEDHTDEQTMFSRQESESYLVQLSGLQEKIHQQENEIVCLKGSLRKAEEDLVGVSSKLQEKAAEHEQSEQRILSVRDKLSIAVSKGKGLIVQRDSLKQSLAETASELERCSEELQLKDTRLQELETRLSTCSEAGERVEALESELSYIRNSATALRESFLLKDSVLQRIEEVLDDLDLPEHFHSRDVIEKIDWLARSATRGSPPLTDWEQHSSGEGGPFSDAGFVVMDSLKEDMLPGSNGGENLRRNYEELKSKFYGLAEQSEMLEQSLMERNKLIQKWEEVLDRINAPAQLQSMEPEDRIKWLGSELSEARVHLNTLQQKVEDLEKHCETLSTDLEESQKRTYDLEAALQLISKEKEHISRSLRSLTHDHTEVSERADKSQLQNDQLQDDIADLQKKLVEKLRSEGSIQRMESGIDRMLALLSDALQDPGAMDMVSNDNRLEFFEELLGKLLVKYASLCSGKPLLKDAVLEPVEATGVLSDIQGNRNITDAEVAGTVTMKKQLEEALDNVLRVEEERDGCMEKNRSLVCEVEALERNRSELQDLLSQEQQKSFSLREKLNVAVRKGKLLVQQRDGLKQTIEEMEAHLEQLKSKTSNQENTLVEYEQKIKELSVYSENLAAVESENLSLRNHLTEYEGCLKEREQSLHTILNTIGDLSICSEYSSDPVTRLSQIDKLCSELQASVASSEKESRKSKREAELLLAELNEVQERNDSLQEELEKLGSELLVLAKQRDLAEAAMLEAEGSREKILAAQSGERKKQFSDLVVLRSGIYQLRKDFFNVQDLLAKVFTSELEFFQNLKSGLESFSQPCDASNVVVMSSVGARNSNFWNSESEEKFHASESKLQDNFDEHSVDEIRRFIRHQLQELTTEFGTFTGKLQTQSALLHEEASSTLQSVENIRNMMGSYREIFESMKGTISHLESAGKEKDTENTALQRNIDLLYEACTSSIMEIEKMHLVEKDPACLNLVKDLRSLKSEDELSNAVRAAIVELQERIRSLTGMVVAKDQEIDSLMHALDEEDTQVEDLTGKIEELEKVVSQKNVDTENLKASRAKVVKKLSVTVNKFDELHRFSEGLVAEVEKLRSEVEDQNAEISFLRQEVIRCTAEMSDKRNQNVVHAKSILSELEDLRVVAREKDVILQEERSKVEELTRKNESLGNSLSEKESELQSLRDGGGSSQPTKMASEIIEDEPVLNKWAVPGTALAPQVRSLRKGNNEQVAIAIDMDPSGCDGVADEDDDKVHGFRSLTTSRIVPKFTRPVGDMVDGIWVSCDRALMRQPALRLGIIIYWTVLHALLATFVV